MKRKKIYVFSKENTFICWARVKTEDLLATKKQPIWKNSVCCFKNQAIFFSHSEHTRRLDHPHPLLESLQTLIYYSFIPCNWTLEQGAGASKVWNISALDQTFYVRKSFSLWFLKSFNIFPFSEKGLVFIVANISAKYSHLTL